MKLTDFIQDAGRPVAYYPKLKRITGSTTATILLCQFLYWRGKESDPDGWLYKTSEQIEDETGLTYNEQKTARKALVEAGLLQEHYARLDHKLRFKIDLDKINENWGTELPKNGESDDSTFGNDESPYSLNSNTENTAENTKTEVVLSEKDHQQVNAKVDAMIGNSARPEAWQGREIFRPDHYPLVDWYHQATGQDCPKRKQKDWLAAVSNWTANNLSAADLQAAYDMDIKWRGVFTSPNQLTEKAIALKAQKQTAPKEYYNLL